MDKSNLNRRNFLKSIGTAAAGLALANNFSFASGQRTKSCVIVGSGLAGLAAAYKLKQAGWRVTVLEARDRVGGRVFSHRPAENPSLVCELGAEWVGEHHERIMALCKEFGLNLQQHRFADALMQNGVVKQPKTWGFSRESEAALQKLFTRLKTYNEAQERKLDQEDWWTYLKKIGFTDEELRLRDLMDSTDFGESIRHVSAYAAAYEYAESGEYNEMDYKITGGNSSLTQSFAERIGMENIRLNSPVTEINQRAGTITIKTSAENFKADACICTVPARSLNQIKFDPPLSQTKISAADRLQYARIVKNQILFKERFWERENFSMVSDVTSHYYFHSTQSQAGTEGILCSYAIGEKADVLAAQDNQRRMEIITRDLLPFNSRAMELSRSIASYAWQRDKYTQGAYALYRPGQWFNLLPALAAAHGKVLFAGEHLSDNWQGFMEGAIETGEAAAQALIGRKVNRKAA